MLTRTGDRAHPRLIQQQRCGVEHTDRDGAEGGQRLAAHHPCARRCQQDRIQEPDGGDPLRPAAPRWRSPEFDGGDPLRPAAPRWRSPQELESRHLPPFRVDRTRVSPP
jgi:hypothetical protein